MDFKNLGSWWVSRKCVGWGNRRSRATRAGRCLEKYGEYGMCWLQRVKKPWLFPVCTLNYLTVYGDGIIHTSQIGSVLRVNKITGT